MPYVIEHERVSFNGKAVRGADAKSFESLAGDWAVDVTSAYCGGRKVQHARREHFAVLGESIAADDKRVFFRRPGDSNVTCVSRPPELDPSDVRCVVQDGLLTVYSAAQVFVAGNWGLVGPFQAQSFVALGQHYVKDAEKVIWFDDNGRPARLAEADAASFVVEQEGARDSRGRFARDRRFALVLPVLLEQDRDQAIRKRIKLLWEELLPRWFSMFDGCLPNDAGPWNVPSVPAEATAILEHRLVWQGGWVELSALGHCCRGKLSAMELLASWLFGVARGKFIDERVCLRVLSRADDLIASAEGTPPPWQTTLDLAYLLDQTGEHQEARLLLERVLSTHGTWQRPDPALDPSLVAHSLVPGLCATLPKRPDIPASTTQSAMQWVVDQDLHVSADALVRRSVASLIRSLVQDTLCAVARLASIATPALALLDDPEPAVVARAAVGVDTLCSNLFYRHDYEAALGCCDALATHGFNWDIQSARRWECLAALGRDEEADAAWEIVQKLNRPDERAPRLHEGLHTDYPSFEAWRAFGELRVALAHMYAAHGEHPSDELRKKKRRLAAANLTPEQWTARAMRRVESAQATMRQIVQVEPASSIGRVVSEFVEALARTTGRGRIEDHNFVMHSQYVDFRRYGAAYQCEGGRIEVAGDFLVAARQQFVLQRESTSIEAVLGHSFGIVFRFLGAPPGRVLPCRIRVTRPDLAGGERTDEYPAQVHLGLREKFVWTFESEDEIAPGPWSFRLVLFSADAPQHYPFHGSLTPREPIASIEQAFMVALPGTAGVQIASTGAAPEP